MSETTQKTIAVFATEYYETSITREPIELNIEDYPELAGMTPEEVSQEFPGTYVKGSYTYDLDYQGDDGDEIDLYIEDPDEE